MSVTGRLARLGGLTRKLAGDYVSDRLRGSEGGVRDRARQRVRQAEHLVETLGGMRGAAMKVGQGLALMADQLELSDDVRAVLSKMHAEGEPVPFSTIERVLDRELDGWRTHFAHLEPTPLGTASLAQAHLARLHDGSEVVVKVLHEGIEEAVRADLLMMKAVVKSGRIVGRPTGELDEVVDELETHLLQELDYLQEAAHLHLFAEAYADDPRVIVPRYRPEASTERVLTMDRVPGVGIDTFLATASREARQQAGENLAELFFSMAFDRRMLHADPHPGNYLFLPDGRIGLLDFGCVKHFHEFFIGSYARVVLHALAGEREPTLQAVRDLGAWTGDNPAAADAIWQFCDALVAPWRTGTYVIGGAEDTVVERVQPAVRKMWTFREITGPRDVLLLHRTLGGLYTLMRRLEVEDDWRARLTPHLERAVATAAGVS